MRGLRRRRLNSLRSCGKPRVASLAARAATPAVTRSHGAPYDSDTAVIPVPAQFVHRILLTSRSLFHFSSCVAFHAGILSPATSPDWTGFALGLGIIPDCDERQDSDKNHDQTDRPPMNIWGFHILLLGLGGGGPER